MSKEGNIRVQEGIDFDEWLSRLKDSVVDRYGASPPGDAGIEVAGYKPLSSQGRDKNSERHFLKYFLQEQTKLIPWIYVNDVSVHITWNINDKKRYEDPYIPDADNITKLILDAISGPEGVIVDDCQIVSLLVSIYGGWKDPETNNFLVAVSERCSLSVGCRKKEELLFVEFGNGLFAPADRSNFKMISEKYGSWLKIDCEDDLKEQLLPIQRFYHKSRVGRFACIELTGKHAQSVL